MPLLDQAAPPPAPPAPPDTLHLIAASKLPELDARTATALSRTGDPGDVLENATAVVSYAHAAKQANAMSQLTDDEQNDLYERMGDEDKVVLTAAGYKTPPPKAPIAPPAPKPEGGLFGFLDQARHDIAAAPGAASNLVDEGRHEAATGVDRVGRALGAVTPAPVREFTKRDVAPTLGHVASSALHALSVPENEIQHFYRMQQLLTKQGPHGTLGFAQAWRESANGATTYDPTVVRALQKQFGPVGYSILENVASQTANSPTGLTMSPALEAQLVSGVAPEYQNDVKVLLDSQMFAQGLRSLTSARLSFGRSLIPASWRSEDTPLGHAANLASGAADGLFDWYSDPTVMGGRVAEAGRMARFGLNGNDVQTLFRTDGQVQRAMNDVAKTVNSGGATAIIEHPIWNKLAPLAPTLAKLADAKNDELTGEDVARYLSSEQGKVAMLSGRAGLFFHGQTLAPHLSVLRQAVAAGAVNLRKAINWAADEPMEDTIGKLAPGYGRTAARVAQGVPRMTGSFMKRVTEFLPRDSVIDLNDPDSAQTFFRTARASLPIARARELGNVYALAIDTGDQGRQMLMLKSLIDESFSQAGIADTIMGQRYKAALLDAIDESERSKRFMASKFDDGSGMDTLPNPSGSGRHAAAVIDQELSDRVRLPDPRELARIARFQGAMGEIIKGPGIDFLDHMMRIWRLGVIGRLGFAFRTSSEELANAMARFGPSDVLHSAAARAADDVERGRIHPMLRLFAPMAERRVQTTEFERALRAGKEASAYPYISYTPLRDIAWAMSDGWPTPVKNAIKSGEDFVAATFAMPRRVVQFAGKRIAGEEWNEGYRQLAKHRALDGAFEHNISAVHQGDAGYGVYERDQMAWTKRGITSAPLELRPGREYRELDSKGSPVVGSRGETIFHQAWAKRLNWLPDSKIANPALQRLQDADERNFGSIVRAQTQAVFRNLQSPEMADVVKRAERSIRLSDGREVGVGGVTRDDALRDWARVATQYVNELVRTPAGRLIRMSDGKTLAEHLLKGRVEANELARLPDHMIPEKVVGANVVPVSVDSALTRVLGGAMRTFVGVPMDAMSREPIFGANYVLARRETLSLLRTRLVGMDTEGAEQLVHDVSYERALRETIPYIHDVRSRTMFETTVRHFVPFLFAQRQFLTRWAKVAVQSPQAFRRAEQIMQGLRVSGFIHRDPSNGQDYFVYPGSSEITNALSKVLSFFGVDHYLPVPTSFTGEIRYLTPGLTGVTPDVGPALLAPLEGLMTLAPGNSALRSFLNNVTEGNIQTGAGALLENLPLTSSTLAQRLIQAKSSDSSEVATSMIQALNYMIASGQVDPEKLSDADIQTLQKKLEEWTSQMLVIRAIFGFAVPSSPTLNIDGLHLDDTMQALLAREPYDKAIADFKTANPDGVPYTIGETGSNSGAELPTTNAGLAYMNAHLSFLEQHPNAGPWLIPQGVGKGAFSEQAYQEQLQIGLRTYRNLPTYFAELAYAQDATRYYDVKQEYEKAVSAPDANIQNVEQIWTNWKNAYFKTHPLLARQMTVGLEGTVTPDQRRASVMSDMAKALAAPDLPKSPTTEAIKGLMAGWERYQNGYEGAQGPEPGALELNGVSADKEELWNLTDAFDAWGDGYVKANPAAKPFWAGVMQLQETWPAAS